MGKKASDSDIAVLLSDPKYRGLLKEEHVREALIYFNKNKSKVRRIVISERYMAQTKLEIQRILDAEKITEKDLMITIIARPY